MKTVSRYIAILVLAFSCQAAFAFDFVPTDSEWVSWPTYCRARYLSLPNGNSSKWAGSMSQAEIELAKQQIGEAMFDRVQHYCAGSAWLIRAKYEPDERKRKYCYQTAIVEANYTFSRSSISDPLVPTMLNTLASAAQGLGDTDAALKYLNSSINAHPNVSTSYIALGILHRNQRNLKAAKEALLRGDTATESESADLNYNLALILLDLKENDAALKHAQRAYSLGYPLPGLRNRLKQLGIWKEEQKEVLRSDSAQ
jgi:tetratricopeptide (TPR) repeat protein